MSLIKSISLTRHGWPSLWYLATAIVLLLVPVVSGRAETPASTPTPQPAIQHVRPTVVQPDTVVTLDFTTEVKATSVKIGNVNAAILSASGVPTKTLDVKVPPNAVLGQQPIEVTVADSGIAPLTTSVVVAPLIRGLKANKDDPAPQLSRFAIAGGQVILQFSDNIPSEIRQKLIVKLGDRPLTYAVPQNDYLLLEIPNNIPAQTYTVNVSIEGSNAVLEKAPKLGIVYTWWIYLLASVIVLGLILTVYVLFKLRAKAASVQRQQEKDYVFVKMLLIEPDTQTYSLSRAQFAAWLVVIAWCYLFLFLAHAYVDQSWTFPGLGGGVYTFLISLGTLVAAQAASKAQGPKGAGEVHPSPADLVVHGGVLALDRVQQVFWTLIALGMFLYITIMTFGTAEGLPSIPEQLLVLMGLSSAGYLGGKLVRGAGPVISDVVARPGSLVLTIRGKHFSKDAFVWLDGSKLSKDNMKFTDDPDDANYANEIEVTLAAMSMNDWNGADHAITIVNDDAQRADWRKSTGQDTSQQTPPPQQPANQKPAQQQAAGQQPAEQGSNTEQ